MKIRRLLSFFRRMTKQTNTSDLLAQSTTHSRVRNEVFDSAYYTDRYPDTKSFPGGAFRHYVAFGYLEGRFPCKLSEELAMLYARSDVDRWMRNFLRFGVDIVGLTAGHVEARHAYESHTLRSLASNIQLSTSATPRVSIIIPHFNKAELTLACLAFLGQLKTDIPYEVILVNDGGSASTVELLATVEGVRFVDLEKNTGFLTAANTGANGAIGEILVFLNNDCFVLQGWLDALVALFDEDATCGIAGSLLIAETGYVSESGGFILTDGNGWNFGRGEEIGCTDISFMRPVDFVSGASLAVRASLWLELGGFDQVYAPAYYEDVDLCFRARRAGYRVLVQPKSRVVHVEGSSAGRDLTTGPKKSQAVNREIFLQSWRGEIVSPRGLRTAEDPRRSSRGAAQGNILVIDARVPDPSRDAGSAYSAGILRTLVKMGWIPTFWAEHESVFSTNLNITRWRAEGVDFCTRTEFGQLSDLLYQRRNLYDVILVFRHNVLFPIATYIKTLAPNVQLIFALCDLHSLREARLLDYEPAQLSKSMVDFTTESERFLAAVADNVITNSSHELQLLRVTMGEDKVVLLPWVAESVEARADTSRDPVILFVGSYGHLPNRQAIEWFLGAVWPRIRAVRPDARFLIVGSEMPRLAHYAWNQEGVSVLGWVEDTAPLYDVARVTVAPLLSGAGIKGKVVESLLRGVPCVGTSIAYEGMDIPDHEGLTPVDSPEAFALAVLRLLDDDCLWAETSEVCSSFAAHHWSQEKAMSVLAKLLRSRVPAVNRQSTIDTRL